MAFPASLNTALTEAGETHAAVVLVIQDIVAIAPEVNMTEVRVQDNGTDDKDVRVIVSVRASGVTDEIAAKMEELFALVRGTR